MIGFDVLRLVCLAKEAVQNSFDQENIFHLS